MAGSAKEFLWGAASASYQVEGAWQAEGKGISNWDLYTNVHRVTELVTGRQQTGNVAINAYDRRQYLGDIALMRELGLGCYRFSLSWARILPEGTGRVNVAGLDHYRRFVDDLLEAGIEPVVTLFHWDLPQSLQERGGWRNRESIEWFRDYAGLVLEGVGDRVRRFITFNEPFIDIFLIEPAVENIKETLDASVPISDAQWRRNAIMMHHWMVASAATMGDFRAAGFAGEIGVAIPMMPTIPDREGQAEDIAAAELADAVINRWCLDAMFRGRYPEAVMDAFAGDPAFAAAEADFPVLAANRADFLGVNFYAPTFVRADPQAPLGFRWSARNPDPPPQAFNGPVRPEALKALLLRIRDEWGNPPVYITENGAGFGPQDEIMTGGTVADPRRADYVKRHVEAVLAARSQGADLRGYMLWSLFDNFEWLQGYDRRFGIVHVDFTTLKRTKKQSFEAYRQIIARGA